MLITESTSFNYARMTETFEMRTFKNDDGDKVLETSYSYDYLEINMTNVRAKALTDEIIDFLSDYFHAGRNESGPPGQEELRSFYSEAKEALDESFNSLKRGNNILPGNSFIGANNGNGRKLGHFKNNNNGVRGNNDLLDRAHQQAVKDLKHWYHNGGKPRERVDFSSLEVEQVSIEHEVTTIASQYVA